MHPQLLNVNHREAFVRLHGTALKKKPLRAAGRVTTPPPNLPLTVLYWAVGASTDDQRTGYAHEVALVTTQP